MSAATINLILFFSIFPVLPILYFVMRNDTRPKKNIMLGVTLPFDARQDERVALLCRKFRRDISWISLLLALPPFSIFFTRHISVALTILTSWMLVVIAAIYVPYTAYHRCLMALKRENNWFCVTAGILMFDTRIASEPRKPLSLWLFTLPVAMGFLPVVLGLAARDEWYMLLTYAVFALIAVGCYFIYRSIYRQRSEVIGGNPIENMALTHVRQYHWRKIWLLLAWLSGLFGLSQWFFGSDGIALLVSATVYAGALMAFAIHAEFAVRHAQEKITREAGKNTYLDDDQYWLNGMFYYNPRDNHTLVNDRTGMNISFNLAKPAGVVIMSFAALSLLLMPFIGLWMMHEEFTPPALELTEDALVARHTHLVASILYEDIRSVDLLEALPSARRTGGTAFVTLSKGRFQVNGIGACELSLNPQAPPFILIQTGKKTYILGDNDPVRTRQIYEEIISK